MKEDASAGSIAHLKKPQLVLRVGFAGNADLGEADANEQKSRITGVLETIGKELAAIAPGTDCTRETEVPKIAKYYSKREPLLRLISGLCEGADALAFEAQDELQVRCLQKENAAVIGFDVAAYRASRSPGYQAVFDQHIRKCSYVLQADGKYEKPPEDAPRDEQARAKRKRNRGYRAQSALLLRQSDLLIAMIDSTAPGKPGGTLETIQNALRFKIPVILLGLKSKGVVLLEPGQILPDELEEGDDEDWQKTLGHWITKIVVDPDLSENTLREAEALHGRDLLNEYFTALACPDGRAVACAASQSNIFRRWDFFEKLFKRTRPKPPGGGKDPAPMGQTPESRKPRGLAELERYRKPASTLSRHYNDLYRNIFFRNSLYAFFAVCLAAASLLLLTVGKTIHDGGASGGEAVAHYPRAVIIALVAMAAIKLVLVWKIFSGTRKAHHDHWNDRGVDYRYLAERLRTMLELPAVGSFQPPAAAPPQYASRVVRQSAVDWLFDAISRSVSPGGWVIVEEVILKAGTKPVPLPLITLKPEKFLGEITSGWLRGQQEYHRENSIKMHRMSDWLETFGALMNFLIIGIVFGDIVLLILKYCHCLHPVLAAATPYIVFMTAIIPAFVASINVVRFQSECQRLAERSAVLEKILGGKRVKKTPTKVDPKDDKFDKIRPLLNKLETLLNIVRGFPMPEKESKDVGGWISDGEELLAKIERTADLGAHCVEVLYYTEGVAEVFVQEVAEWSVLYAQELIEP